MKAILVFIYIVTLGISLVLGVDAYAGNATFANKRAIQDGDIDLWTNKDEIDRRLQRIKEAGFNVYMPLVWYGRGTTWLSKYAPWDFALVPPATQNNDPLGYSITKAHQLGLEVHPWFMLVFRRDQSFMPELGLQGIAEDEHAAFDIHNPAFREFMTNVVLEVVTRYDIDGLNLDYARAMGLCSSFACEKEYHIKYNRNLGIDSLVFKVSPEKVPSLIEYQESAVTALIKSISHSVRRAKPTLLISVDGHPELPQYTQGQNTVEWASKGLVDVILRMDYHPRINTSGIEQVKARLANPTVLTQLISNMAHGADLAPSQKPYARSGQWLADTISMISTRWPDTGIAVYFYKYLTDDQIAALRAGPFRAERNKTAPSAPSSLRIE